MDYGTQQLIFLVIFLVVVAAVVIGTLVFTTLVDRSLADEGAQSQKREGQPVGRERRIRRRVHGGKVLVPGPKQEGKRGERH